MILPTGSLFRPFWIAVGLLIVVGACAQRSDNVLEQLARSGIGSLLGGDDAAAPPPLPTRAQLDQIDGALLSIQFKHDPATGFVGAINRTHDGYVTYQDKTRRSIIVRGALVTGVQGFKYDLSAIKTQADDPIVNWTPVASWPKSLFRNYQYTLQSAADYQISVKCDVTPLMRETIVVFEKSYDVTRLQEVCSNDQRQFTNTYWADTETGFIWRSEQWLGPNLRPATINVVNPFRES